MNREQFKDWYSANRFWAKHRIASGSTYSSYHNDSCHGGSTTIAFRRGFMLPRENGVNRLHPPAPCGWDWAARQIANRDWHECFNDNALTRASQGKLYRRTMLREMANLRREAAGQASNV